MDDDSGLYEPDPAPPRERILADAFFGGEGRYGLLELDAHVRRTVREHLDQPVHPRRDRGLEPLDDLGPRERGGEYGGAERHESTNSAVIGSPALRKLLRGRTSMRTFPVALRRFTARLHTVGTFAAPPDSER